MTKRERMKLVRSFLAKADKANRAGNKADAMRWMDLAQTVEGYHSPCRCVRGA